MRALVILLLLAFWASSAVGQEAKSLTIDGGELVTCSPGDTFCFAVSEGDLEGFVAGQNVTILFRSIGVLPHNLLVTTHAQADPDHMDTSADVAIASTEAISAGAEETITFIVPLDAQGLYFWCDVGDHEAQGMWIEADVTSETAASMDNDTMMGGNGSEEPDDSPVPLVAALIGVALAALVLGRKP